jgi:glutamine amidotransferase
MLTFLPEGVQPDTDALWNGSLYPNNDGHGFAIVSGPRLIVRHDLDAAELIDVFAKTRKRHPSGPAIFHSRLGTGGVATRLNCHPFRFGGDRRTVVGHNGVLPEMVQPGKGDRRCDTRIAAEELLPSGFGHLGDPASRAFLADWIGPYNKLAILTVNPAYGESAYLINEQAGNWDDGIWYSNRDYQVRRYQSKYADLYDLDERCDFCGTLGRIDPEFAYCMTCGSCADCGEVWADNCQCAIVLGQRPLKAPDDSDWHRHSDRRWWVAGDDRWSDLPTAPRQLALPAGPEQPAS